MEVSEFYRYQAQARKLTRVGDVKALSVLNTRLYNDIILPWLPLDRSARIYEVACGPGVLLTWLRSTGYSNIRGSDFSEVQIEVAAAGGFDVRQADSVEELRAISEGTLDCIIALDFYEHLEKSIFLDFLSEAYRALKPGGRLILRGPNGDTPVMGRALYNDITHITTYTSVAMNAVMEMIGFRDTAFRDDTLAAIQQDRWIKVPLAWLSQQILRTLIRLATRENILYFSASYFICSNK